jgi:hypothetical protein
MFSLAEKVTDSSMKGLCLNRLHLLFCHYDPTPGHLTLLWINLLLLKISAAAAFINNEGVKDTVTSKYGSLHILGLPLGISVECKLML